MGNEASVAADGALRAVQERFEEKVAKLHNAMAPPNCRTNYTNGGLNGEDEASSPQLTPEQIQGKGIECTLCMYWTCQGPFA